MHPSSPTASSTLGYMIWLQNKGMHQFMPKASVRGLLINNLTMYAQTGLFFPAVSLSLSLSHSLSLTHIIYSLLLLFHPLTFLYPNSLSLSLSPSLSSGLFFSMTAQINQWLPAAVWQFPPSWLPSKSDEGEETIALLWSAVNQHIGKCCHHNLVLREYKLLSNNLSHLPPCFMWTCEHT